MRPDFDRWLMNIHRAGLCGRVVAIFQGQDRVEVDCQECAS